MLIAVILLAVLSVVLAMDLEAQQQEIERLKVLVEKLNKERVWLGLDLSMSDDITAVAMVTEYEGEVYGEEENANVNAIKKSHRSKGRQTNRQRHPAKSPGNGKK